MSGGFIFVCEDEELRQEGVELPAEGDGTLLLAILQSQYEGASGLKYRSPTSGLWRAVKIIDGVLYPPDNGWGGTPYVVVKKVETAAEKGQEENGSGGAATAAAEAETATTRKEGGASFSDGYKRKMEDEDGGRAAKNPRSASPVFSQLQVRDLNTEDLIILGLEYSVTDAELKKYFEQFGEVAAAEVKKDMTTKKSRGFGFVRFFDPAIQGKVQAMPHTIKGRRVEIKHPKKSVSYAPSKLFVGCLPLRPEVDSDELREYFGQYGALTDVYVPHPYRGFGFITYQDGDVAKKVLNMPHTLRKSSLNLSLAEPRGGRSQPSYQYSYDPYHQQWYDPNSTYAAAAAVQQNSAYGYGTPSPYSFQGYRAGQPGHTFTTTPRVGVVSTQGQASQAGVFPAARQGFQQQQFSQQTPHNRGPPPPPPQKAAAVKPGSPRTGGQYDQQHHYTASGGGTSQYEYGSEGYYAGQGQTHGAGAGAGGGAGYGGHGQQQQQPPTQQAHGESNMPWQNY